MPIYLRLANLIINKTAVEKKYLGGVKQFRIDFSVHEDNYNQEDLQLFCICKMNADEFNLDELMSKGLHYDEVTQTSTDFTINMRYGGSLWESPWLDDNTIFAWHIEASQNSIERAKMISNESFDNLDLWMECGNDPFSAIL